MFTLPSFTMADILTFYKVIRIKTEQGAELPFVCVNNQESRSWKSPEHPTDRNTVISDTLWTEPKTLTLSGHVPAKSWERFRQLIEGSTENGAKGIKGYFQDVKNNVLGSSLFGSSKAENGPLGLYTVTLLGGVYEDMSLISFTRSETPDENTGFAVTMEFKQMIRVEAQTSNMAKEQVAAADYGNTLDKGKQNPKEAPRNSAGFDMIFGN